MSMQWSNGMPKKLWVIVTKKKAISIFKDAVHTVATYMFDSEMETFTEIKKKKKKEGIV